MMSSEKVKAQVIWPMIEKLIAEKGDKVVKKPPKEKKGKGKAKQPCPKTTLN